MGGARRAARKARPASEGGGVGRGCARAARRKAAQGGARGGAAPGARAVAEMRAWIAEGQRARFGARRLAGLDLDDTGLLQEAVDRGQDAIAFALLQAGVRVLPAVTDPRSSRHEITPAVRRFPPQAQVWIAALLQEAARPRARSAESAAPLELGCTACAAEPGPGGVVNGAPFLIWPTCEHAVCGACAGDAVHKSAEAARSGLRCPTCGGLQPDDLLPPPLTDQGPPEEVRERSLTRFAALPAAFVKALHGTPKPKLARLSPMATKYVMPGDTQDRRLEKFMGAVLEGDPWRVRALIDLGVDINHRDQHGATALLWATMLGERDQIADLLLMAGADPDARCSLGVDRAQILLGAPAPWVAPATCPDVRELIPWTSAHPGAGSFVIDGACSPSCVRFLLEASAAISPVPPCAEAPPAADRRYLLDTQGWIGKTLADALRAIDSAEVLRVFPTMRTLTYAPGISLAPHIDLHRTAQDGLRSTHTFILYLDGGEDFDNGGATALLQTLKAPEETLAVVSPRPCRLLVFPHHCPHEGRLVIRSKVILRGEIAMRALAQ